MSVVVPVRVVESSADGVLCRLGSEPAADAPVRLVPASCIVSRSIAEGFDLAVLVIDESSAPKWLKDALGLD